MAQDGPGRVREAVGAAPHGAARGPGVRPPVRASGQRQPPPGMGAARRCRSHT